MAGWLDWSTAVAPTSQTTAGGLFGDGPESSFGFGGLVDRDQSSAGTSADDDIDEETVSPLLNRSGNEPGVSPLFDHDDADVIFRSCDGVDFRLHKVILRLTSPVLRDMFSLPDEPSQGDTPQTVEVSESTTTLENLLSFCYPMEHPEFMQLSRLLTVLEAAQKYDMSFVMKPLVANLKRFLPSEPLRLYAIAYRMEDGDLARAAAKRLLDIPSFYNPPEPLPSSTSSPLSRYARKGNAETSSAWVWLACASCEGGDETFEVANAATGHRCAIRPRAWWRKYADAVALELLLRPVGCVATRSHMTRAAIDEALKCKTCAPKAAVDLMEYGEAMAKRIDEATSKIQIELPF
ncbi:hypothetical protein C8Q79DRAFT_1010686 [Trametes meyenii]|nr:hypothetical protein C8Q79DRAFT_1010686 [Trametes meyenii]